jgi:succinyl-CoA synthetase beta subunit
MKIYEFQAKNLFSTYTIPVPKGRAVRTPEAASLAARELGFPAIVKVQIHAGGRGKAGGVKKVSTPQEAERAASQLLGSRLVTEQTGPGGRRVEWLLVEEAVPITREIYLGLTIDRKEASLVLLASGAGGVEIEKMAREKPGDIATEKIDPGIGLRHFQASRIGFALGFDPPLVRHLSGIVMNLYRLFIEKDCSHAEINPLAVLESGSLMAVDAKMNFDDNALFRHADIASLRDPSQDDPLETEAAKYNLNYIKLTGNVGCMVNGAGLAMATMDLIKLTGGEPANFLDVGGGATTEMVRQGMKILVADKDVKVIFINIFGGILRCDVLARGVAEAARELNISLPVVVRMEGTNVDAGRSILADSGLRFISVPTMKEATEKIAGLLGEG